jgi:hypothetical protein
VLRGAQHDKHETLLFRRVLIVGGESDVSVLSLLIRGAEMFFSAWSLKELESFLWGNNQVLRCAQDDKEESLLYFRYPNVGERVNYRHRSFPIPLHGQVHFEPSYSTC